jgi:hypothetical protein
MCWSNSYYNLKDLKNALQLNKKKEDNDTHDNERSKRSS